MPPAVLHSKLMDSELAKASIFFVEIEASFIFMDCVIVKPKIHMQRMNIVIIFCSYVGLCVKFKSKVMS